MSDELNVSSMPTDWWAWTGDALTHLGICEDFDEGIAEMLDGYHNNC